MKKTTPPPPVDVLEILPELANTRKETIRLHPRQGEVTDLYASKIGGIFLWPSEEPWVTVPSKRSAKAEYMEYQEWKWDFPDGTPIELVPVLQLNKKDVPEFPFPEDKDLFQLLWYPLEIDEEPYHGKPYCFWRNIHEVKTPLNTTPVSKYAYPEYIPKPCQLTFERVLEYPPYEELSSEQQQRLLSWANPKAEQIIQQDEIGMHILYDWYLSSCPGNKLLGHIFWYQWPEYPICSTCQNKMEHLLTLTDMEVDGGTWQRWLPEEDRTIPPRLSLSIIGDHIVNPADFWFAGGSMYYFICFNCKNFPVQAVYQR